MIKLAASLNNLRPDLTLDLTSVLPILTGYLSGLISASSFSIREVFVDILSMLGTRSGIDLTIKSILSLAVFVPSPTAVSFPPVNPKRSAYGSTVVKTISAASMP